jgi:hypothetical protein
MSAKEKLLELDKATIYVSSAFGWDTIEANAVLIEAGSYAQYPRALYVSFRRPRKRKRECFVRTDHRAVVIDGWGHAPLVKDACDTDRFGNRSTRYGCFDEAYTVEFREALAAFIASNPAAKVHDFMVAEQLRISLREYARRGEYDGTFESAVKCLAQAEYETHRLHAEIKIAVGA